MKQYKRYKALLQQGHCGAGSYVEVVRYIMARDMVEAMNIANTLPSIKKGRANALIHIEEVKE